MNLTEDNVHNGRTTYQDSAIYKPDLRKHLPLLIL